MRFFSTVELVNALERERALGKAGKLAEMLTKVDLVILDELGYLPFSSSGGALLFHLLSKPYERTSLIPLVTLLRNALPGSDHHQLQLLRMGAGIGRCQKDHRAPRSAHTPLPHPGNRKRQLALQSQLRGRKEIGKGDAIIDRLMTARSKTRVGQTSVKTPGQFSVTINRVAHQFVRSVSILSLIATASAKERSPRASTSFRPDA